jgi:magnesium transporter
MCPPEFSAGPTPRHEDVGHRIDGPGIYRLLACLKAGISQRPTLFLLMTGSMLLFVLKRLGFDPATASAPFVATLVDVTGLVIYFTVALLVLGGTLL